MFVSLKFYPTNVYLYILLRCFIVYTDFFIIRLLCPRNTSFMLYDIDYSYRIVARNIVSAAYYGAYYGAYYDQDIPIDVPAAGIEI